MIRAEIEITLELIGPFITKSSAPGAIGLDDLLARDAGGKIYIPATHVTGKLRQAWEELANCLEAYADKHDCVPEKFEIDCLLGDKANGGGLNAQTKRVIFSDFVLYGNNDKEGMRYRIRIDEDRGAVKDRFQLMLESPFSSGEEICFTGKAMLLVDNEETAMRIKEQIQTGLQWISQMGAYRTQGFGCVKDINVHSLTVYPPIDEWPLLVGDKSMALLIKPFESFCVDAATPSGNLFYSSEVISGGTILGCLYNMMGGIAKKHTRDEFGALRKNFHYLRVRHAFPSAECLTRPVTIPLSLVQAGGNNWDVALEKQACLIENEPPSFAPDWKNSGPKAEFGWPKLERELRVRTAIDSQKDRARDEQLFSYDMIKPDGHCWLSQISLSDVPEEQRDETGMQLRQLLSFGLVGLGKSKALADITLLSPGEMKARMAVDRVTERLGADRLVCITLQTDALLLTPNNLDESSGRAELHKAYKKTWDTLCNALDLKYFYAQQELKGGYFLAKRYQRWGNDGKAYYPWLITRAGSVFVFEINDTGNAENALQIWLRDGLPFADNITQAYGIEGDPHDHWKHCPYVPHNGYGEIAVNLEVHERWSPGEKAQPIGDTVQEKPA